MCLYTPQQERDKETELVGNQDGHYGTDTRARPTTSQN